MLDFWPVKRFKNRGDVWVFRHVSDSASKGVLGVLKSIYLGFRKVKVQRVTVVEFGMYDRNGDGVGCISLENRKLGYRTSELMYKPQHNVQDAVNSNLWSVQFQVLVTSLLRLFVAWNQHWFTVSEITADWRELMTIEIRHLLLLTS